MWNEVSLYLFLGNILIGRKNNSRISELDDTGNSFQLIISVTATVFQRHRDSGSYEKTQQLAQSRSCFSRRWQNACNTGALFLSGKASLEMMPTYSVTSVQAKPCERQQLWVTVTSWAGIAIGFPDCQARLRVFTESTFLGRCYSHKAAKIMKTLALSLCSPYPGKCLLQVNFTSLCSFLGLQGKKKS